LLGVVPVEEARIAPLAAQGCVRSNDAEAWAQGIEQTTSGNHLPFHTSNPRL
jgi:hypothetical protein